MEGFLKQKLQLDFSDCWDLDKEIILGNVQKETGTLKLFNLIDRVKSDIATMDNESWLILCDAEKKILDENEKRKEQVIYNRRVKDASEKRDLELVLLREDYQMCKQLLYFIQSLCFTKGWFQ